MNDLLVEVVDKCAQRFNRSREEFILLACQHYCSVKVGLTGRERHSVRSLPPPVKPTLTEHYIGQLATEDYQRLFWDGCLIEPNDQEWAEGVAKIVAQVWQKETW
jgi:hypothetical protein